MHGQSVRLFESQVFGRAAKVMSTKCDIRVLALDRHINFRLQPGFFNSVRVPSAGPMRSMRDSEAALFMPCHVARISCRKAQQEDTLRGIGQ